MGISATEVKKKLNMDWKLKCRCKSVKCSETSVFWMLSFYLSEQRQVIEAKSQH